MFSSVVFQTADLKWFVPMIVGAVSLIGCVVALFWNRSWSLAVVGTLAVALIGASVFNKISVTKEGVIIETAQLSAQALVDLQNAAKSNSDAIAQLTTKVNDLALITQKALSTQSTGSSDAGEINKITRDTRAIQEQIKQNDLAIQNIGRNNERITESIGKLFKF